MGQQGWIANSILLMPKYKIIQNVTSGQGLCICSFHWGKLILPYLQEKINENGSQNVSQVSTEDRKNREIKKGKTQGPWPSCCCYSVTQSSLTPRDPIDCSTPGLPVLHYLPEFGRDSCPLSRWCHPTVSSSVTPSPALNLPQLQGLFQRVGSLHQEAKVLELQHESFQWIFRIDFL